MEPNKDQLYQPFISYLEHAKTNLPLLMKEMSQGKIVSMHPRTPYWFRTIVEKIETSKEFENLVTTFSVALGRNPKIIHGQYQVDRERGVIRNFFRRSKLYLRISRQEFIRNEEYFDHLWTVFNEREVKIITLRPIEGVDFSEELIDFETFKIQRFSKMQFDQLVDNEVNNIFYPSSELDYGKLYNYWFIREEGIQRKSKKDLFLIDLGFSVRFSIADLYRVPRTFPDRVIQLLALFDWENKWTEDTKDIKSDFGWLGFSIPISLQITNDYFQSPPPSPNLSRLDLFPVHDSDGEEIGEAPQFHTFLENEDVERLKEIIGNAQNLFKNIDLATCNWEFMDIAMGYLAKALLTEGLEQLLWHMTVIDALLGDKKAVIASIKRRVPIIMGKTEAERKEIRDRIDALYDFRSNLVHGNKYKGTVFRAHLREARKYARDSLLWVLTYLSTVHEEFSKKSIPQRDYPDREEILNLLDFKRSQLERLVILIAGLPDGFPNIKIWGN